MDLSIYEVIRGPRMTSKAYYLDHTLNQLVLDVHPMANKPMVVRALKQLFNVEVEKVSISVSKGKEKKAGRYSFVGKTKKKAIVTLKSGYSVDIAGWKKPQKGV